MGERDSGSLQFGRDRLVSALAQITESAWSIPSTYQDTGVHHGYRRVVLVSAGHHKRYADLFGFVWEALHPVRDVTLSRLESGGFIAPHRDAAPWFERWQVPIISSGQWHGDGAHQPAVGVAFPVAHWEPHAVTNRGPGPRIHLVIDRDIPIRRPVLPFEMFPVPADMADLVDRSRL